MSYLTGTTHFNLPQTAGTDKRDWADTNQAFADVDAALYQASQDASTAISDASTAQTTANTAVTDAATAQASADAAAASAATAGELAQHVSVELGTLANLTTTDKTSAVAAINEVNSDLSKKINSDNTITDITPNDTSKHDYIAPSDGYILLNAPTSGYSAVYFSSSSQDYYLGFAPNGGVSSVYVKGGSVLKIQKNDTHDGSIRFVALS